MTGVQTCALPISIVCVDLLECRRDDRRFGGGEIRSRNLLFLLPAQERQLAKGDIYESWNVDDYTIDLGALYGRTMHDTGSRKSVGPECGRPNIRAGL